MEKNEKNQQKVERVVKELLAEILGIETDDIDQNDYLTDDLHMGPTEITDLAEKLSQKGVLIPENTLQEISTVGELIEYITNNVDF